jgi:hypothetical protein
VFGAVWSGRYGSRYRVWRNRTLHAILHVMSKDPRTRSVQRYRERMKRAGLRLVQFWVPDTRARGFAEECRRQSRAASRRRRAETDVMTWIEQTRDTDGWTG